MEKYSTARATQHACRFPECWSIFSKNELTALGSIRYVDFLTATPPKPWPKSVRKSRIEVLLEVNQLIHKAFYCTDFLFRNYVLKVSFAIFLCEQSTVEINHFLFFLLLS